ncbi:MAG: hypothetical protein AAFU65_17505 [Pseudomonadota bacterium]
MSVTFLLTSAGVIVPDFITTEWAERVVAALTPFLVWLVPNKPAAE